MTPQSVRKPTIKDVAALAGVSTATVSYVVSGSRFVSPKLARRIRKAIKELHYAPSRLAQGLRNGRMLTIGLVVDDITSRFSSLFTKGLESVAADRNYSLVISNLRANPDNERRSIDLLADQKVAGIIYCGYGAAEERLLELDAGGLPVVIADEPLGSERLSSVLIDNKAGVVQALEHLEALGHREIFFINGAAANRNGQLRAEAFGEFLRQRGLPFEEDRIVHGDYTLQHGYQAAVKMLNRRCRPTAVFCGDDMIAFGVLAALRSRGLRVPEDVAVVGFDDDPLSRVFEPSLTTVHYPMEEMGRRSFEIFERMLGRRQKTAEHVILETKLMVRRSTDPTYRDGQEFIAGGDSRRRFSCQVSHVGGDSGRRLSVFPR
jgi:DNA-binding LacI/PurR family transcriptional regulator